jgi:tetratricopeptide (TPR) repeat protein
MGAIEKKSPFKFLDAYNKEDRDTFFGREEEIEKLYEMAFQSNLTLVYGQSGTGKTSLIQCGLANRFNDTHWFDLYIRRNEDINASILRTLKQYKVVQQERGTLRQRLMRKRQSINRTSTAIFEHENEVVRELRRLYKHYLKPIYLIFDQFEELFILGTKEEQAIFYQTVADILATETYCRVIIIMREESIAQLYQFEKIVPNLFEKRLRVEPLNRPKTRAVINGTIGQFGISLEKKELSDEIIDLLSEGTGRIELTHLQVVLDQLYKAANPTADKEIVFTEALIQKIGSFEDILGDFLNKQKLTIQQEAEKKFVGLSHAATSKVLNSFVTLEGTKKPISKEELAANNQVDYIIDLLEKNRLIRFDNDRYELSHDILAKHIASDRSADEVALLQISKIAKDRFHAYGTTKTLLNNNEVALIWSFKDQLKEENILKAEEWRFVEQSRSAAKRKRILFGSTVFVIVAALSALAIYSNNQRQIAQESLKLADARLVEIQNAQVEQQQANYEKYLNEGIALMATSKYSEAIQAFQTALDFNADGQAVKDNLQVARTKMDASSSFEQLIMEGDAIFDQNDNARYIDALNKYKEALSLDFNNSLAQSKINATQGKLAVAFEKFKGDGEAFFNARTPFGYKMALDSYRKAAKIKPNDPIIQRRIEEVKGKL